MRIDTAGGPVLGADRAAAPATARVPSWVGSVPAIAPGLLPGLLPGLEERCRRRCRVELRRIDTGHSSLERDVAARGVGQGWHLPDGFSLRTAQGPLPCR